MELFINGELNKEGLIQALAVVRDIANVTCIRDKETV